MSGKESVAPRLLVIGCLLAFTACTAGPDPGTQDRGQPPSVARNEPSAAGDETPPAAGSDEPTAKGENMAGQDWSEVERLISEQKFQAAAERTAELKTAAREAGEEEEWTRALIKEVQLRTGLHGYETAVRFLRDEEWPEAPLYRAVLHLFYGRSLSTYNQAYSWEIGQRERVETGDEVDLKAWTQDQIAAEAQRAYLEVWKTRGEWGAESLGELAEYVEQNDYPARIRGTLRDAVTYLWVELLADTSLWRPEQSNEIFRLDAGALVAGGDPAADAPPLADPAVHPLVKIGAILDDLEAWHGASGRPEAAFEARLERLRRLRSSFDQEDDRRRMRQDLERRLDALGRGYEWWSMGMATLAEWVRDDEGDRPRARQIALEGQEAHPESAGGQRCRHVVAGIEAPHYELTAMAADGAGKRSIQVRHKNLETLHFRSYTVDLAAVIEGAKDYSFLPSHRQVPQIMANQEPVAEWGAELPPTPDYDIHRTYVTPPIEGPGLFVIVASARRDFGDNLNSRAAVNLMLTDLVLLARQSEGDYQVTVRSGQSGDGVGGVAVSLYRYDWRKGHRRLEERTTGDDGRVSFTVDPAARGSYFLLARRGDDAAILLQLGAHRRRPAAGERTAALLYTDRSVYRPQQTLLWKAVAYRGVSDEGRFRTAPETRLTVDLLDANREVVASAEVETNAFGSASGEFAIPAGRLLGSWHLRASLGGSAAVQVEEYKRPTFEVTIADPESTLRLNRPATLRGEVRYYFGLPVASGEVAWRVTREPIYPRWWWWLRPRGGGETQVVASGATDLDADGSFAVTFTPQADERLAQGSPRGQVTYRYRLAADVTDEGGETRSAARAFRLGFVAVEARVTTDQAFFTHRRPVVFEILRSDLDGVPRAGEGRYRLVALDQPAAALLPADQPLEERPEADGERYQTPGDLLRPRWEGTASPEAVMRLWSDGEETGSGTVEHGEDGKATLDLGPLSAGAYRLHYRTTDEFGAEYETAEELVVVTDRGGRLALPAVLLAERTSVAVGETARFLVHSGLPDQEMVFEVFRRRPGGGSEPVERKAIRAGGAPQVIEIAIDSEHRGGFSVGLTCLRDHQLMRFTENVLVPWDDRELRVEFATFRDLLRPKARETWRVTVRGSDEAAVGEGAAEVLAYMYDRSLDLFAPHRPPRPLDLYPTRYGAPNLRSSLGSAGPVWRQARGFVTLPGYPSFRGDRLKFYDNYGIGGPGRRHRRGPVMMRSMAMAEAPMAAKAAPMAAAPAPAPPAPEAETATMDFMAEAPPAGSGPEEPEPAAEEPLRTDFAETAFWEPHLLTAEDGAVSFEFTVPDSVTEWNVWVHALTRDLRAGSLESRARSVKELMVRPYLPRFFREGDRAELKVVVNNASDGELRGRLDFEILDPETDESLLAEFGLDRGDALGVEFAVPAGGGTDLTFPVVVPQRVGQVAIKAVARAGDLSDGELRPLPVLPGRLHLVQSRFATLHDRDRRTLEFADMASGDDPTRADELLVVTLDAQLFYSVLGALPYLVEYPYQCSEQLLNRFLSTGIVASLYDRYPAVSRMAKQLSERETRTESWSADDPNRRMALEETPWLRSARGGAASAEELTNVLDPAIAGATRDAALAELEKAQTSLGGFPWWPGGPPSPHMTLYILQGFSRALEFGVEVPQEMVVRAWSYLHRHYVDELARRMVEDECCWEMVTFLNWVLSSYPDESWTGGVFTADDRRRMLDFSFRHWQRHSPLLKGYLALTLKRAGRGEDAELVWNSVMDSAKTTRDEGTFWAPEDRAWLWYNDTIETHAFALRTLAELEPADARRHGLVQWLFLNKKLNHWKSTRATAEVIYSLVHYLEAEDALAVREAATVTVGPRIESFEFDPDEYTGKRNQVVVEGSEIDPATMSEVVVEKETPGFLFASATWHFATDRLPAEARGDFFTVERRYFRRYNDGREWVLKPLAEGAMLAPGDQLEVQLSLRTKHAAEYVHLRDPRGAGFEPESTASRYKWDLGIGWYEEIRDSGTNFFFDWLPVGEYTFKYRLRANLAGAFRVGPATIQSMYAPEFAAYSSGARLSIGSEGGGER